MVWKTPRCSNSFRKLPRGRLKVRARSYGKAVGVVSAVSRAGLARCLLGGGGSFRGHFAGSRLVDPGRFPGGAVPQPGLFSRVVCSCGPVRPVARRCDRSASGRAGGGAGDRVRAVALALVADWLTGSFGPAHRSGRACRAPLADRTAGRDVAHALAHRHRAGSRRSAEKLLLAVRHAVLARSQGQARGVLRRGSRRFLGFRGLPAAAALLPAGTPGFHRHAGMARRCRRA